MHAVVRTYSGQNATQLFDLFEQHKGEIESLLRSVPGLVSYTMARTADGGVTVTVCKDKSGTDQSLNIAREWIKNKATAIVANPPTVAEGSVIVSIA